MIKGSQDRPTYSEVANDHHLITTHKPRGKGLHGGSSMHMLSPIKSTVPDLQKKLDGVIRNIESNRAVYERCLIEARKAGELSRTLAEQLRYSKVLAQYIINQYFSPKCTNVLFNIFKRLMSYQSLIAFIGP